MKHQVVLIICDGWGYREDTKNNAIAQAKKPNFDYLWQNYPHAILKASGQAVGLPVGQIGTSEANHLIIGSGRIVYQNLLKINNAIEDKSFFQNPVLQEVFDHVKKFNSVFHIMGLVGPGGVHCHSEHLKALVIAAKQSGIQKVALHLFTDGRDVPPRSAIEYVKEIEYFCAPISIGRISTIGGRYFAMDRDNNHDRTEKQFQTMINGQKLGFKSATQAIEESYKKNINDEFIEPTVIESVDGGKDLINSNDAVIFANFRSDRSKQLVRRFLKENIPNLKLATITKYASDIDLPVLFPPETINNTLSNVLSANKLKQIRITETEKFTHLTFFFNAQKYESDAGEERVMIPSNKDVATHDKKPEMKALEIAKATVEAIKKQEHDFICINLVNADMVGHSAIMPAVIKGIEAVDQAIGQILETAKQYNVDLIITADHGNAEEIFNEKINQPITAHTLNPVPFILFSKSHTTINHQRGSLSDIAPTVLKLFSLPIPPEMTGKSFV